MERQQKIRSVRVSWQDIVKLVDAHPAIAAGRYRARAARAGVDAVGSVPNPSLEAAVAHGRERGSDESRVEWGLGLSVPLGWIAQREAKMNAADSTARAADAEVKVLRRDILLQLRILFWNLVYEQERVLALEELSNETGALVETVKQRIDKGEVRPIEATRVEVEAEKIDGELDVARFELKGRRAQLATWLGVRTQKQLVAVGDLTTLPRPMTVKRARETVRVEHPIVVAETARVEANLANLTAEHRARVPSFSVEAFTDHELDRLAYGIGLTVDLPLWNWNRGNIQQAEDDLAASRKQLEAQRFELEIEVIEAQVKCQAGVELAARYNDRILPRATSSSQTIERTYQLGEATLFEVIDARRTLIETKRQFLSALVQAQTECSRLTALAGEDLQ